MHCIIESPGLQLDKRVGALVQLKFEGLEKIYDRITNCQVMVRKVNNDQNKDFQVKAQLTVPKKELFAQCEAETIEIGIQMVIDSLVNQLRRYKSYGNKRKEIW